MSSKEKVLSVYPMAYYYYNNLFGHFSIFADSHTVIGRGNTEQQAWDNAAKMIENE